MARARHGCGFRFFLLVAALQSSECIAQIEVPQIVPGDPSGTFFAVGNWGWNTNPTDCPLRRMTGVTAFADPKSPSTPDDDSEYAVFCRSDGIFLVDVTPVLAGVGNAPKDLRPRGTVQYVQEPDWSYLGPAFTIDRSNNTVVALPPAPPNAPNGGSHLDDGKWIALNGGMSPQNGTWSGASITPGVVAASYCRNLPVSAWAPYAANPLKARAARQFSKRIA